ncbi:MAG: hypothetical protein LJE65_13175, partial [Desulfobacteraceae bacterium]|nr:hypothetical protein [Desulfobacteraceae bacterium]
MPQRKNPIFKMGLLTVWIRAVCFLWVPGAWEPLDPAAGTPYRVHIAFGFHGNLYHSFRVDTDDENGFGQDIRVIRHILDSLDRHNQNGIPVKAVWDFDNLFSLQEILPRHAPDVLTDLRRRIRDHGDEAILMSYNNGLASAMTGEELRASIRRAVSNQQGSGVLDLFGSFSPIVRPQEMMTSPGNFDLYRSMGIPAVCLYYSATPFDAFRLFSRKLSPAEAHNPLRYRNPETGEHAVIIPTYHIGDLVEHVGLRQWAQKLHRMQREGEIDRDVLIFLNFDADSEFWTGTDLAWYLDWLPNTGGIDQLIESVADLHFVSFTTLGEYLQRHSPVAEVHFE